MIGAKRPRPPGSLSGFARAEGLEAWARRTFIDTAGPLANEDHAHLQDARIGMLWAGVENVRRGRVVSGSCELTTPPISMTNRWHTARWNEQLEGWFGPELPDFLVTIYAPHWIEASDASACALMEHELYHAGQAVDEFGAPRFRRSGLPVWTIRGHDVEEHIGVVRRYGAGHSASGVAEMVAGARRVPEVAAAKIIGACGTCMRGVA